MQIIKRDGTKQEFDSNKIKKAILGAMSDINSTLPEACVDDLVEIIVNRLDKRKNYNVEQLNDLVELTLMEQEQYSIAKAFIEYRQTHKLARNKYQELMKIVTEKLEAKNVQNQNANLDENTFSGREKEAFGAIIKEYALNNLVSETTRNNHLNNEIYIHDLDAYASGMHNCLSIPLDDLLQKGFKVKQTDIRPAGSVNTAMQLSAVIMQLQSLCQFGGVAYTHFDWSMVPYVRKSFAKHYKDGIKFILGKEEIDYEIENMLNNAKDYSIEDEEYKAYSERVYNYALEMTEKEIHQSVEALYHNLNSLQSRSGQQLPFSSLNYGTCTLEEGRIVTKELLEVSIEGLGRYHRTSIFPCGIFQLKKGINREPGEPNYDLYRLALKSTSLRLYPNYANVDWTGNKGYDENDPRTYFSTMGCRTANGADINVEPGVNPQMKDGRGNIAPTTIILPTLAMEADRDVEKFMLLLDQKIHEAKDSLIDRFNYICSQSPKSAPFMYDNNTFIGYKPEEGIRSALRHGTIVIGQLGLSEALQLLIGKDHTTEEGMELAKRIEQLFKDRCCEFKQEYKLNFGVYYTPAESLCKTAMIKFKEKYGIIENVSDKKYFTNSIHVPVYHKLNAFEKIDIESQLTGYSGAGCITYVELDSSSLHNIDAIEKLVNYAMDKDIPYFAINVPNDVCMDCGHQEEMNDKCPICGSENIERLRRVTGYLSTDYHNFNEGKIQEVEQRVKHTGVSIK